MKGLILKDIYNVKNQWKYILFIAAVFSLSFGSAGDGMLASMFSFLCTILTVNNLAQDEVDQWALFAATMPVSRRDMVLSKYILTVFLCVFGAVGGLVLTWMVGLIGFGPSLMDMAGTVLAELVATCGAILIIISVMIPMNLKFGIQKARFLMMAFVAVPFLVGLVVNIFEISLSDTLAGMAEMGWLLGAGAVVLVAAVVLISYFSSVRIMEKKEF